jgi:hypothetical protein
MTGIAIKDQAIGEKKAFLSFLNNSTIKYLSRGSFGTTFIATLDDPFIPNSPYKSTDAETYGQPVPTIIIKIVSINDEDEFINEVNIQKEIYSKTMEYLEPICPAIVYSKIYESTEEKNSILNKIRSSMSDTRYIESYLDPDVDVGIIVMEFADGYKLLHYLQKDPNYKLYKNMIMFLLLELALKTGYSHADFHIGNLMINTTSTTYFKQTNPSEPKIIGKPLLIDFGLTNEIPHDILNLIKEHCDKEEYTTALHYLCEVNRRDNESIKDYPEAYGWVCGSVDPNMNRKQIKEEIDDRYYMGDSRYDVLEEMADISNMRFAPDTNETIKLLFKQRKKAIKDLVITFNPRHIGGPQLPLNEKGKKEIIEKIATPLSTVSLSLSSSKGSTKSSPVDLDFLNDGSHISTPNYSSEEGMFAMSP